LRPSLASTVVRVRRITAFGEGVTPMGTNAETKAQSTSDALALLTLPALDGLTDEQARGAVCVWDATEQPLTGDVAVYLGERMSPLEGTASPMRWFPRACRHHVRDAAHKVLMDHAPRCEQCVENAADCDTGRALLRLMRDHR
jgi:hypothetical protein